MVFVKTLLLVAGSIAVAAAQEDCTLGCTEDSDAQALLSLRASLKKRATCPGSGEACHGDQCCPGIEQTGFKTFPCPSAAEGFAGCAVPAPPCDLSGCAGCQGEEKERECCRAIHCKGAQGEQVAKCMADHCSPDDSSSCDLSGCAGCQGEQCTLCREVKERECCRARECKGAQGEQMAKCMAEHCSPNDPSCDLSGCDGCQGEQCTLCREDKERDCCRARECKGAQGEQVAECMANRCSK